MAKRISGVKIKMAREIAGLTQEQLAEKLNVEQPTITRWETGVYAPRGKNLLNLARVLKKEPEWFFDVPNGELAEMAKRIEALESQREPSERIKELEAELASIKSSVFWQAFQKATPFLQNFVLEILTGKRPGQSSNSEKKNNPDKLHLKKKSR